MLSPEKYTTDDARTRRDRFIADAMFSLERGISIIPLDGKTPPRGLSLKTYTERHPTEEEVRDWARRFQNLGNVCGGISRVVGIDADSAPTVRWVQDHLPRTSMMTRSSPEKMHFY